MSQFLPSPDKVDWQKIELNNDWYILFPIMVFDKDGKGITMIGDTLRYQEFSIEGERVEAIVQKVMEGDKARWIISFPRKLNKKTVQFVDGGLFSFFTGKNKFKKSKESLWKNCLYDSKRWLTHSNVVVYNEPKEGAILCNARKQK